MEEVETGRGDNRGGEIGRGGEGRQGGEGREWEEDHGYPRDQMCLAVPPSGPFKISLLLALVVFKINTVFGHQTHGTLRPLQGGVPLEAVCF